MRRESIVTKASGQQVELFWCQSIEGVTWQDGLAGALRLVSATAEEQVLVRSLVRATVKRLVSGSLTPRLDVRPVVLGDHINLFELRWELRSFGIEHPLRLYFFERGISMFALCFRSKLLQGSNLKIRDTQNTDILTALQIAEVTISKSFRNCVEWSQEIE